MGSRLVCVWVLCGCLWAGDAVAQTDCVPAVPAPPETLPQSVQEPAHRSVWLRDFAQAVSGSDVPAPGVGAQSPRDRSGLTLGQQVRGGDAVLSDEENQWLQQALECEGTNDSFVQQLLDAALNALKNAAGANPDAADNANGAGGGGGGGGYAPGSPTGSLGPTKSPAEQAAEDRCVAGLAAMISGIADLQAGMAAHTAEASAQVGRAGQTRAAALLASARKKLECGRITLGSRTYAMAGLSAAECRAVSRDVHKQDFAKMKLPSRKALAQLPAEWQKLVGSDPTGELVRDLVAALNCRQNGGSCRVSATVESKGIATAQNADKVDAGAACRKDGNLIVDRLLRIGKDDPCTVDALLVAEANRQGVPPDLVRAVAWTESNWRQFDRHGRVFSSYSNDYGLMQINKKAWGGTYNWSRISNDVTYNIRAGVNELRDDYARAGRAGYRGAARWRSAYAMYNGGPKAVHRPWRRSRWRLHDVNFYRHMRNKPWRARTQNCQ